MTPDVDASGALTEVAQRVIWFETPATALSDPARFLAYAFAFATADDMAVVRRHFDDDALRDALDCAPPGIIDPRSWSYWHTVLSRSPIPPMPNRTTAL